MTTSLLQSQQPGIPSSLDQGLVILINRTKVGLPDRLMPFDVSMAASRGISKLNGSR
jgi:hypothetical protein